ncbi:MAG: hypothetical protein ABW321_13535 [Polyangiales bacterium]
MTRTRWSLLLMATAAVGCGGENELETCDIREAACQREVFLAVQDVRGATWDPWLELPPMRVITRDDYRRELEPALRWQAMMEPSFDYQTEALKLLRLIDPNEEPNGETEFMISFVAAFYDSAQRSVTIIDRGSDTNRREDVRTLAHELVHAAQERDVGFGRIYADAVTRDNIDAISSLLEGEATLYANLVDAKQAGLDSENLGWRDYHTGWIEGIRQDIAKDVSPYRLASTGLRYPLGSRYLTSAWLEGGPLAVRRVLDARVTNTQRLLAGRGDAQDRPLTRWECARPDPPEGQELVLSDSLGAYAVFAFATRVFGEDAAGWELAGEANGDRITVFGGADEEVSVVWSLRFRSAEQAAELEAAIAASPLIDAFQRVLEGDTLHVLASSRALEDEYPTVATPCGE